MRSIITKITWFRIESYCNEQFFLLEYVSGSYDHTVKMYDTRGRSSVLTVQHGHPVESVLLYPSDGILLSAGNNSRVDTEKLKTAKQIE